MGCGCGRPKTDDEATQTAEPLETSKHTEADMRVESICGDLTPRLRNRRRIYRVVLTGGPCAGKSTLLSTLQTKMEGRLGVRVYTVPEAATMLVNGGMRWSDAVNPSITTDYQLALLRVQLALEDQCYAIARATQGPALIVCDRGTMDGRAFCSEDQFNEILRRGGWSLESLRDERYDAIIHMVSAAIGAEAYYNLDNAARSESVEEARQADMRLRRMYVGHPLVRVFDNSTSFEDKLERVVDFIGRQLGNPTVPRTAMRRYLVQPLNESDLSTTAHVKVRLTINILNNSSADRVMLVLKRVQRSSALHLFQKLMHEGGSRIRIEHRISGREYTSLLAQRDAERMEVVKHNVSFVWGDNYYEIGEFEAPSWAAGKTVMYVESHAQPVLPPFVKIIADITDQPCLSSYFVAHRMTGTSYVDPPVG